MKATNPKMAATISNLKKTVQFEQPEKIPMLLQATTWPFAYAGVKWSDVVDQPELAAKHYMKVYEDFQFELTLGGGHVTPYKVFEAMGSDKYYLADDGISVAHSQVNDFYVDESYYELMATDPDYVLREVIMRNQMPALQGSKEEAMAAFLKNYLSTKPFLIKHKMYKDTILESYILFNKDGKYYSIMGGYKAGNFSKKEILEIQEQKKKTLIEAFGKDSCNILLDGAYSCSSDFELVDGKWEIKVQDDGRVRAAGYDSFCVIDKNGGSGFGVTPQS